MFSGKPLVLAVFVRKLGYEEHGIDSPSGPRLAIRDSGNHMYLTSTLKRTLAVGGVSLLAVVGLIGWTRQGGSPVAAGPAHANYLTTPQPGNPEPISRDPNEPVVYAPSPFGTEAPPPQNRTYNAPPEAVAPAYATNSYAQRTAMPARVITQRRYYTTSRGRRRYVVVRKRPFSHSAAIVGGSAAGGALIGALAGGGQGAAIGALAGGGSGLVYDRLTNKKRLVSER
jgi:hypothetical protein